MQARRAVNRARGIKAMGKTILFVDEEPLIHRALQRALRDDQATWQMHFAGSPQEGLAALGRSAADVLVTEVAFAGQSGLDFLSAVRERHPQTARIILSGFVDREILLKTSDLAHQFLSKPVEADELKAAIGRAFMVKELLAHVPLKKVAARIKTLPSLPALYQELTQLLKSEDASIQRIGDLIAKDMALSAKLLKMVNSSYFGLPQQVSSPAKAVSLLGLDLAATLVLASGAFDQFNAIRIKGFSLAQMWNHAMAVAAMAKTIAHKAGLKRGETDAAFTAGLLHDIGKLLLAAHLTDQFEAVLHHMQHHGCVMAAAEREILGTTHASIGAYLLGLWGLPERIIAAAAFHHEPAMEQSPGLSATAIVHMADAFAHIAPQLADPLCPPVGLDISFLEKAGVLDQIPAWRVACARVLQG
jgi:putative nucleotidyltransferase with HDIG domain